MADATDTFDRLLHAAQERVTPKRKERGGTQAANRENNAVATPAKAADHSWREHTITAKLLRAQKFAPVNFILPGLMPEGVTLLVSKPKLGKSWMALDFCIGATMDRYTLGDIKPAQGDVLYLALEDSNRRLKRRLGNLLPELAGDWPDRLTLATKWKRLNEGGKEAIRDWCKSIDKPTFICIDTLALIRPSVKSSQQAYQSDYEAMTFLHDLTSEFPGLGIVVVHHDRKMEAEDPFDTVSGTQGLVGAADTIWIIKRNASGTTLHIRGRDVEESEKAIEFNKSTCRWTILGSAVEVHRSNERARVLTALQEAGEPLSVNQIKASAQLRTRNAADLLLGKMARDREIERAGRGLYSIPTTAGQIGQTERSEHQDTEITDEIANLSNLSDLSEASDRTKTEANITASKSARPREPFDDLGIPDFLRRSNKEAETRMDC